jgi:NTE family protein
MNSVVHADVAQNFEIVVDRVRKVADTTVDAGAIIGGLPLSGSISDRVAKAYDSTLFHGGRLNVLPDDSQAGNPRFVINATNMAGHPTFRKKMHSRTYLN